MKTRITLILLTAFALCSCLGGQQNPDNSMNIRKKEPYQDASFVLAQMCHWDNLVFDDGEWKVIEMTKSEIEESWFDKKAYDDAKRLAKSHNKTLKKMLSRLEDELGIKDYVLHSAVYQKEYANSFRVPGAGIWKGLEMNTYDASFVQKTFEVEEDATRQLLILDDRNLLTKQAELYPMEPGTVKTIYEATECLHLIAVEYDQETHVYVNFMSGPIYVALPGTKEEVKLTYMTSCPQGGRVMW